MRARLTNQRDDPGSDAGSGPPGPGDPEPPTGQPAVVSDRRAFIRQVSGEAVVSAGRIAGVSAALRRSIFAAGAAVTRDLEGVAADPSTRLEPVGQPSVQIAPPLSEAESGMPAPPNIDRTTMPSDRAAPDSGAVAALTPAQHDFLAEGTSAVVAINDPAGSPHLSSSMYRWDGTVLRFPSRMFSARARLVDRDPRVAIHVSHRTTEGWVAITGVASVVYGQTVEAETLRILERYLPPDSAATRWAEMRASGDAILIEVQPTRFLWGPA